MVDVDADFVVRVCQSTTSADGRRGVVDVATDPLDGSVWVRMASGEQGRLAAGELEAHGLAVTERADARLQVTGWDARLLRRRLGTMLAGVDDLEAEWDSTAELVRYYRDRRVTVTGECPDPAEVLADVERALRQAQPIPHTAPYVADVDTLVQLVTAAETAYGQLIVEHVEHAAAVLEGDARRAAAPLTGQ